MPLFIGGAGRFSMFFTTRTAKPRHNARLTLETLEDRTVPAVVDMTTVGASASVNTVVFKQSAPSANSSAEEFLRLDSGRKVEQGYNSNGRPQFDERNARTHAVQM